MEPLRPGPQAGMDRFERKGYKLGASALDWSLPKRTAMGQSGQIDQGATVSQDLRTQHLEFGMLIISSTTLW